MLFEASICLFQLTGIAATGSRPNPNGKSERGRLRSHPCMIVFSVSDADEETQPGGTSPIALVACVWPKKMNMPVYANDPPIPITGRAPTGLSA